MSSGAGRVLIIGGGIGGVSAALALRQAGREATVFEQAPELKEVGAGITLWSNAVRAMRLLGLGEPLAAVSTAIDRSQMRSWRGQLLGETSLADVGRKLGAPSVGVHRADLLDLLVRALPAGVVCLGARCVGFERHDRGATALFADGRREEGDVLVGADGLKSKVREQLLGDGKPRYAGYAAWRGVARFEHPDYPPGLTSITLGGGGQFGMLPIGKCRTYWFGTVNRPEGGKDGPAGRKRDVLDAFGAGTLPSQRWWRPRTSRPSCATTFATGRPSGAGARVESRCWVTPPTRPRRTWAREPVRRSRTPSCSPIVWAKAAMRPPPCAYEQARFDRTAAVVNDSRRLGSMLQWRNPVLCWLRDSLIRLTPRSRNERMFLSNLDFQV